MMEYTIVKLRENLSEVLSRVHHRDEVIDVSHYRKPYAALVSKEKGELIRFMDKPLGKDELQELRGFINGLAENKEPLSLSEIMEEFKRSENHKRPKKRQLKEVIP